MTDPTRTLDPEEYIVFDVRHNFYVLLRSLLPLDVFIALWALALFYIDFFRKGWPLAAGIAALAAVLLLSGYRVLAWSRAALVLTDRRLIYRSGLFSGRSIEIPLSGISDVTTPQTVLERFFGLGDVVVECCEEGFRYPFTGMPRPVELKGRILEQALAFKDGTSREKARAVAREVVRAMESSRPTSEMPAIPPERPPVYSEIVDQIERLDALRRRGVLSDEEFQKAKEGLLGRLGGGEVD